MTYNLYTAAHGDINLITKQEAIETHLHPEYGNEIIVVSAKNEEEALKTAIAWDKSTLPGNRARHPFVKDKAIRLRRTSGLTGDIIFVDIK